MKKTLSAIIVILLMIFVFMPQDTAFADYDYFELEHSVSPTSVPEGGGLVDVTVKISVDLNSAYAMNNTKVYNGDTVVIDFRNIYAGQTVTKTGSMQVAAADVGKDIALTLKWTTDGSNYLTDTFTVKFNDSGAEPEVEFSRTAVPQSGEPQTESKLTYTVNNVGTLHITEVEIKDPLCGAVDYKELIKAGESYVFTYERTISSGFSSKPTLTYKVGEKSYSEELDDIEITSGEPDIELKVETNKDVVAAGEELTVICTITNTGDADFTFVKITEALLGDMFETDSLEAGESKVFTTTVKIEESQTLEFMAAGGNGTEQEWVDEKSVDITVDEGSAPLEVEINASPSSLLLQIPGMIDFDIVITNDGEEALELLKVIDQDDTVIVEIASLPTGKSTYQWSAQVDSTKVFTFYLQVPQDDGTFRSVNSGPIEIKVEETPETTGGAVQATPTATTLIGEEEVTGLKKIFGNLGLVVAIVLAFAIIVAIIVSRSRRR
jgi:hypothetical protein